MVPKHWPSAIADQSVPVFRSLKDPSNLLGKDTFFSDSPDSASSGDGPNCTYLDDRQEQKKPDVGMGDEPSVWRPPPSTENPKSQIAPWISEGPPPPSTHGLMSANFYNDGPANLQYSPSLRPGTGRTVDSESPDAMFAPDDRRPSLASATTVDSQNSTSRASTRRTNAHKKITNFFGSDGRQSSVDSDASIPSTLQRERTNSRQSSIHTSHTDGPSSPTSSRPRSPLPSSDVTPWVFQEFQVCLHVCAIAISTGLLVNLNSCPTAKMVLKAQVSF